MGLQINVCCGWGIKSEAQLETLQGDGDAMAAVQAVLRYMYFGQNKIRKETCFIHIIKRLGTRIIRFLPVRPSTSVSAARAAADPVMGSRPLSSEGRRAQSSSSSAQASLMGHGQRPEQPQGVRRERGSEQEAAGVMQGVSVSAVPRPPSAGRKKRKRRRQKKRGKGQMCRGARQWSKKGQK